MVHGDKTFLRLLMLGIQVQSRPSEQDMWRNVQCSVANLHETEVGKDAELHMSNQPWSLDEVQSVAVTLKRKPEASIQLRV